MPRRADRRRSSPAAVRPARGTLTRAALAALCIALAALLTYALIQWQEPAAAQIPSPPEAARQPDVVREHLTETYRAAQEAPRAPAAVGAYCLALHADMFHEEAEACYQAVIELAPEEWQWACYRALLRSDLGDSGDVAALLRAVVAAAPEFAPAWLRLGDAEFKAGRYDQAEQAWTRVLALPEPRRTAEAPVSHRVEVPASSHASLGIARVRLLRGDRAGAQQILERLTTTGPPFSSAYRLLAQLHAESGRDADAARALARARRLPAYAPYADPMIDRLALESRNSTFLIRLASEANLAINGPWSEYLTRRALQFDPANPEVVTKLARVLRTLGKNEEALHYFLRYQEMVPGDVQVLAHIGSSLSELGRFDEAEPFLRRAAALLDDALSHYNLALLLAVTGRLDEAVEEYERALERDPADVTARTNLAAVLVRRGELDRAAGELTRVLALDPEHAMAHANLGLVHAERGDLVRARRALQQAIQLDPTLTPAAQALEELGGR